MGSSDRFRVTSLVHGMKVVGSMRSTGVSTISGSTCIRVDQHIKHVYMSVQDIYSRYIKPTHFVFLSKFSLRAWGVRLVSRGIEFGDQRHR